MKIAVAQTKSVKGDIESNIYHHKKFIRQALLYKANLILFPELSITGYEPERAKQLATTEGDNRFNDFQKISDTENITICIGIPSKADNGIFISMLTFQPEQPRKVYSKRYLHADEEPYFARGLQQIFFIRR